MRIEMAAVKKATLRFSACAELMLIAVENTSVAAVASPRPTRIDRSQRPSPKVNVHQGAFSLFFMSANIGLEVITCAG